MLSEPSPRKHRWLILPPIAVGIAILVWMAQGREPPARVDADERAHAVRVIEAPALELVPTAEGCGPVRPSKVWKAVAQVAGRIIEVHPRLRDGEILAAGTELLRIDPIDYELAQAEAELAVEEENVRASLEIEARNQRLADQELERLRKLSLQGTVSNSDVDQAERTALATRSSVQTLKNQLTLVPTRRRLLESQAVRNGTVYLVDDEQRLRLQQVDVLFSQDDWAVIADGVEPGDRVVLSDLIPAVPDMLLDPRVDSGLTAVLARLKQPEPSSQAERDEQQRQPEHAARSALAEQPQ